jgi:transcription initiation factor IIE alpha subunit
VLLLFVTADIQKTEKNLILELLKMKIKFLSAGKYYKCNIKVQYLCFGGKKVSSA